MLDMTRTNQPMTRPNILFIFADQMRASALGCVGEEHVATPHLDTFAAEGIRLRRAIANTPVCCPARATLLTGLHTLAHQVVFNDVPLRTDVTSLAHCLNAEGYRCGYIGKWHLDTRDRGIFIPPGPRRQGFDDFWAVHNCNHRYSQGYYYLNDDPTPVWIDGYEPQAQTDLAIRYLHECAAGNQPFCLFLSWGPPHCPYRDVPDEYLSRYPVKDISLRPNAPSGADREAIAGYYAHVTALDECFGRLMQALATQGIADETLVVFTSDHGDMLFSQDRGWKCKPWSESINIPFLARWPGQIPAGTVSDGLFSLVDVMPTLLALAGVAIPPAVQGRDLSALLRGDESASPESVFINLPVSPHAYTFREWRGVVTRTHTYARFRERPWLLYDDQHDLYQLHNLAESPDAAGLQTHLDGLLQQWLTITNDPFESSDTVADRYYQGHGRCMMPYYENAELQQSRQRHYGENSVST